MQPSEYVNFNLYFHPWGSVFVSTHPVAVPVDGAPSKDTGVGGRPSSEGTLSKLDSSSQSGSIFILRFSSPWSAVSSSASSFISSSKSDRTSSLSSCSSLNTLDFFILVMSRAGYLAKSAASTVFPLVFFIFLATILVQDQHFTEFLSSLPRASNWEKLMLFHCSKPKVKSLAIITVYRNKLIFYNFHFLSLSNTTRMY